MAAVEGMGGDTVTGVQMCFFSQAEDGIRASPVTGVQTCALPISGRFSLGTIYKSSTGVDLMAALVEAMLKLG